MESEQQAKKISQYLRATLLPKRKPRLNKGNFRKSFFIFFFFLIAMIAFTDSQTALSYTFKNPCACGKEPKEIKSKSDPENSTHEYVYFCNNNPKCKYYKQDSDKIFTFRDVINSPAQCIFNIERERRYDANIKTRDMEYVVPLYDGFKAENDHPTHELSRHSPFCFESSSIKWAELWKENVVPKWRLPSPLWLKEGIDIIDDKDRRYKIVQSLTLWSKKTDLFIVQKDKKYDNLEYTIEEKKNIANAYDERGQNTIEWEKFWVLLHGSSYDDKGWLFNEHIDYILFECQNGFFSVKRTDMLRKVKDILNDMTLAKLSRCCTHDPREAHKKPFINACNAPRHDYKMYFLENDIKDIIHDRFYY